LLVALLCARYYTRTWRAINDSHSLPEETRATVTKVYTANDLVTSMTRDEATSIIVTLAPKDAATVHGIDQTGTKN
jgi:hypothetical protein